MKKKPYIKPIVELFEYRPEEGYSATQIGLRKDYVLVEGNDRETMRSADEVTEHRDENDEWSTGLWE